MIDGILNHIYDFFYTWLFGSGPTAVLTVFAESITLFISLVFIGLMIWAVFSFVFGFVKAIYNFIRGF